MSAPIAQQIISTLRILMCHTSDNTGLKRIKQLEWNTHYFRERLIQMGFIVYGERDSPVVPLMLYLPAKAKYFNKTENFCIQIFYFKFF